MEIVHEEWRQVKGMELYEVSDAGRVRSFRKRNSKVLGGGVTKGGYRIVDINGRMAYVHRLVLEAFIGPCPPRHEACHGNGIKSDNRLTNLRWDTRSENNADRVQHGTSNRGERCGTSKLTEKQAMDIISSGETDCELAERFGVARTTINRIRSGRRWGHLKQTKNESKRLEAVK